MRISDFLRELDRAQKIKDYKKRAEAFEILVASLRDFAYETKDEKMIRIVQEFTDFEERSRPFYEIEALMNNLKYVKQIIEEHRVLIPSDVAERFLQCFNRFKEELASNQKSFLPLANNFDRTIALLNRELIGRRLEKEIVPDLAEKLQFSSRPNILPENDHAEIEVDFLGEKETTNRPLGRGRLKKKEVLIVECKTTISKNDIVDFSRKVNIIKSKYEVSAKAFQHNVEFEVWIFACYGWTKELKDLASKQGFRVFDADAMKETLDQHQLLDHRMPICP